MMPGFNESAARGPLLSVIVPVYNEAATVHELLRRVVGVEIDKQVIVVDDGSTDGTSEILNRWQGREGVELLAHAVNRGKGAAIRTGLKRARGQFTIVQDADLEYDPGDYERLLRPLLDGTADVVYGSRYWRGECCWEPGSLSDVVPAAPWSFFRLGVSLLNAAVRWIYGDRLTDEATCYKVFSTEALRAMGLECERFEFCPEVTAKACRMGLRITEVPVRYSPRDVQAGKKIRWRDGVVAAWTLWRWRKWSPACAEAAPEPITTQRGTADLKMIGKQSRLANTVAALLLCMHAALLAWAATKHSPTNDEIPHMAAGLSHWRLGRFDLYPVNPPLVRLVATLPVALSDPKMDWQEYPPTSGIRTEFECGARFIAENEERSFWYFTLARWACIPFSMLGGLVCYRWAGTLYGAAGGLLALSLWCVCPSILAHGQLITPDLAAAAFGAAAWYVFWQWLRAPSWPRAFGTGAVMGLAELSKTTFIIFYALWPLAWIAWRICGYAASRGSSGSTSTRGMGEVTNTVSPPLGLELAQLTLMLALSVYVINLGYVFEDSGKPLGEYTFVSKTLTGTPEPSSFDPPPVNRFRRTILARVPVPLPANYVLGIDLQKRDFESGFLSYLRGEWRDRGWWYYYLYGLAIKTPLGTWALLLLAICARYAVSAEWRYEKSTKVGDTCSRPEKSRRPRRAAFRDEIVLLLPALSILVFVSSQTGFNHHLRYVLPIVPFFLVWIGRLGPLLSWQSGGFRSKALTVLVGSSLAWMVVSSLYYYPHSLSYFNEAVGGPLGGRRHMIDSNIDWGQDVFYLKSWLDEHPQARPLGLAFFGFFDPRIAGIDYSLPPPGPARPASRNAAADSPPRRSAPDSELGPLPGWYAVSATLLQGCRFSVFDGDGGRAFVDDGDFTYFQHFAPVATAGYSIFIYHLEPAAVDRVRRKLGLQELDRYQ